MRFWFQKSVNNEVQQKWGQIWKQIHAILYTDLWFWMYDFEKYVMYITMLIDDLKNNCDIKRVFIVFINYWKCSANNKTAKCQLKIQQW